MRFGVAKGYAPCRSRDPCEVWFRNASSKFREMWESRRLARGRLNLDGRLVAAANSEEK